MVLPKFLRTLSKITGGKFANGALTAAFAAALRSDWGEAKVSSTTGQQVAQSDREKGTDQNGT